MRSGQIAPDIYYENGESTGCPYLGFSNPFEIAFMLSTTEEDVLIAEQRSWQVASP